MPTSPAIAYILVAAAMAGWWLLAQRLPPVTTICPHCGDIVEHTRGWPTRCPSCTHFLLG